MRGTWKDLGACVVATLAAVAMVPGAASAATLTVQGDPSLPAAPLGPGTVVGGIDPSITLAFTPEEVAAKRDFTLVVTDAAGNVAGTTTFCRQASASAASVAVDYRGNGAYTATLVSYPDSPTIATECQTGGVTTPVPFAISAATSFGALPGNYLFRDVNSLTTKPLEIPVALVPGGLGTEVAYAAGGQIDPATGGISGPAETAPVLSSTGKATLFLRTPGRYTLVSRTMSDNAFTPWSAPAYINVQAPFDLESLRFSDPRGPSYRVTAKVGEKTAEGKVTIALARGKKKGRFRTIGSGRISRTGTVVRRFTQRRSGTYRIRFTFKGSTTTTAGEAIQAVRFTRRVVLR